MKMSLFFFRIFLVVSILLQSVSVSFAQTDTQADQIKNIVAISNPLERLKTIKSTLKTLSNPKDRIQFMRGYLAQKSISNNTLSKKASYNNNTKLNVPYIKQVNGKAHIYFNGKDYGDASEVDYYYGGIIFSDKNIAISRIQNNASYITYNEENLGEGEALMISDDCFAYKKKIDKKTSHLILNGKDLGDTIYGNIQCSGSNITYVKNIKDISSKNPNSWKSHVFFNEKDLGEGSFPVLDGNDLAYINSKNHVIYNGKDVGTGSDIWLSEGNIAFVRLIGEKKHIIFNGQDIGEGNGVKISGKNIAYTKTVWKQIPDELSYEAQHLIFNNKDLGELYSMEGAGTKFTLLGNNIIYTKNISSPEAEPHTFYNENDLGINIKSFGFVNGLVAYNKGIGGKSHIIFNGKDIGEGHLLFPIHSDF